MESITAQSNAKINLFFAINSIRADQYCDITSLMAPISLCDKLTYAIEKNTTHSEPQTQIIQQSIKKFPPDNNTITQAVRIFADYTGIRNFFLRVTISKKIPIGGGFGGGSSNAALSLITLNRFYSQKLTQNELIDLAKKIGTDCPFFVKICPQLATGCGDILAPIARDFSQKLAGYHCLIFFPNFSVSTQNAYQEFKKNPKFMLDPSPVITKILNENNFEKFLYNTFAEQILHQHPFLSELFSELRTRGYFPCVTGSGSGCFILHAHLKFLEEAQAIIARHPYIVFSEIVHFI